MSDEAPDPISAVFRRTKADGTYCYSDAEVRHYLPLMIVMLRLGPELLSAESLQVFADFVAAMQRETPGTEVTRASVIAYYDKHPVNPELALEMKAAIRQLGDPPPGAESDSLERLVASSRTHFEAREAPKAGQVRAGPLARFTVDPKRR